jgi:hypothetical protein
MLIFGDRDDGPLNSRGGYDDRTTALTRSRASWRLCGVATVPVKAST